MTFRLPLWATLLLFLLVLAMGYGAYGAGTLVERSKWRTREAIAVTQATAVKRVTEAASKAASLRTGEQYDEATSNLRSDYAFARERLRAKPPRGAGDLPRDNTAPDSLAQAPGTDFVVVETSCRRCALALIDLAEEGDIYRLQVIAWQAWWQGQQAAVVTGETATTP